MVLKMWRLAPCCSCYLLYMGRPAPSGFKGKLPHNPTAYSKQLQFTFFEGSHFIRSFKTLTFNMYHGDLPLWIKRYFILLYCLKSAVFSKVTIYTIPHPSSILKNF